jgi:hypothetical protein
MQRRFRQDQNIACLELGLDAALRDLHVDGARPRDELVGRGRVVPGGVVRDVGVCAEVASGDLAPGLADRAEERLGAGQR